MTGPPRARRPARSLLDRHPVEQAVADDAPAIDRLYRESVRGASWLPADAAAHAEFAPVSQGESIHVTKDGTGEVAGFVSVYVPDSFIHHLFVAPRFQGAGRASALLASLEAWLPLPWRLKCVRANTHALSFYASRGWQAVGAGESKDGPYLLLEFDPRR